MPIQLIDKIKPKNNGNFPMVDAEDVEYGGQRLPYYLDKIGEGDCTHTDIDCGGEAYTLSVANNTIYNITNCTVLTITLPDAAEYSAHLFIQFADTGEVGMIFPEGSTIYGSDPNVIGNGDAWEVSVDSVGGILCLRKVAYA